MATVPEIRKRAGMSRYALAQAAELSYQGLTNIETGGVAEAKVKTIRRISKALAKQLGVNPDQLMVELTADLEEEGTNR